MIDLHSHILPGLDDGAVDADVSLAMARKYVEQGVRCVACTPHILPGLYHNSGPSIRVAVETLQKHLDEELIPLRLLTGADNHIVPDFVAGLRCGQLLTLGDTRYVLVEPPHHVAPMRLEELLFAIAVAGYVPILTHPERLTWIENKYDVIQRLPNRGVWLQLTSASLRGRFGKRARYWADRMLSEGLVHILATDAHDDERRKPDLLAGRKAAEKLIGAREAEHLVVTRPMDIVADRLAKDCIPLPKPFSGEERLGSSFDEKNYISDGGGSRFAQRLWQFFH